MINRGMPGRKISTVYNGVDSRLLKARDINRTSSIRDELGIDKGALLVCTVALLRPRKGVEVAIRAMKYVRAVLPDAFLVIVGNSRISEDPDYESRLRRMSEEPEIQGHIFFPGFREDVAEFMRESDVIAVPSLYGEGLPMVILESMALGVLVVASAIDGITEVVQDNKTGFCFLPGDSEELARKIIVLFRDTRLAATVSLKAKTDIDNRWSLDRQVSQIEQIYSRLMVR
jgi:glycosyltransferase involved in cell wall biosynthesis